MEITLKSGTLSSYGYSLGYVNRISIGENTKQLYKEHSIYNVKATINKTFFDKQFEKLAEAKKYFNSLKIK